MTSVKVVWNAVNRDGGGRVFDVHIDGDEPRNEGYISGFCRTHFMGDGEKPTLDVSAWSRRIKSAMPEDVFAVAKAWQAATEAVETWNRSRLWELGIVAVNPDDGETRDLTWHMWAVSPMDATNQFDEWVKRSADDWKISLKTWKTIPAGH